MQVENRMTGAAVKRFDFLVRTRELKANKVSLQAWRKKQGPN